MDANPPERPPARRAGPLAVAVLVVAAAAGGWALARRPGVPAARPAAGDVLLAEGSLALPASRRLRVRGACVVEIALDVPAGAAVEASFGPPGPVEALPDDAPDPAAAVRWSAKPGDAPRRELVMAAGLFVLRLEAHGGASAPVGVRVRALPPR